MRRPRFAELDRQARLVRRWTWPDNTAVLVVDHGRLREGRTRGTAELVDGTAAVRVDLGVRDVPRAWRPAPLVSLEQVRPLLEDGIPSDAELRRELDEALDFSRPTGTEELLALVSRRTAQVMLLRRRARRLLKDRDEDAAFLQSLVDDAEHYATVYLHQLGELHGHVCVECGCTEDNPCEGGCHWVAAGLCSACVPHDSEPVAGGREAS